MRKIYPLPFNKFAVLVLYGLLSIAVITLAQKSIPTGPLTSSCGPKLSSPSKKQVTIGYVQLNNAMEIPWGYYDYINVIAYPKTDGGWNDLHPPPPPQEQLKALNDLKTKKPANTQILLSIRNYDITNWPEDKDYAKIVTETINTIKTFDLDGVDIEYPGMRGFSCTGGPGGPKGPDFVWNKGRDAEFVKFIGNLKAGIGKIKGGKPFTLMLTVGSNAIDAVNGDDLDNNINFLNIETYHFSLYANLKNFNQDPNAIMSYPNAPYKEFTNAHDAWFNAGIGEDKIIMGVDFGNTLQVVFNPIITTTPEVNFILPQGQDESFRQDPVLNIQSVQPINSLCSAEDKSHLFTYPWKDLLEISKCKKPIMPGWVYNFDDKNSKTPWLYKEAGNGAYYFISFEDFDSLNSKLNYVTSKSMGGVSISDVSYDGIGDDSLIGYVQTIRSTTPSQPNPNSSPNPNDPSPKGKEGGNPTSTDLPLGGNNFKSSPKTGAIIGGVFGSLGLIILGACGFYFYRYRGRPKSASFRSLLKFKGFPNSGNHVISRNPEMTTEPTPNLFAPPTTVIPVASGYVTAMFDFTGKEENDLSFKKGDKIEVLERGDGPNDWWVGRVNGAVGEFPGNYVKET